MANFPTESIIDSSAPFLGMRSAADPITLGTGIMSLAQNLRGDGGTAMVRKGSSSVVSSGISGATFKGIFSGSANGNDFVFAAFRVSSETRVYRLNGSAWSEITGSGTRFSTDGAVGFSIVTDYGVTGLSNKRDVLVAGVTGDSPRVSDLSLPSPSIAVHQAISAPTWVNATAIPYGWFRNVDEATAFESDSSKLEITASVLGPDVTVYDALTDNQTAEVIFQKSQMEGGNSSYAGLTLGPSVVIFADDKASGQFLWDYVAAVDLLVIPTTPVTGAISTTAASASVITVTTSASHGLSTGDYVRITGVSGFNGSMGSFRITSATATTFTLDGTNTTGSGTGGSFSKLEWVNLYDADTAEGVLSFSEQTSGNSTMRAATIQTGQYTGRTGWAGVRFTSNANAPDTTFINLLSIIATTGYMDGRCNWRGSLYSTNSRSESESVEASKGDPIVVSALTLVSVASKWKWDPQGDYLTSWRVSSSGYTGLSGSPNYALFYRSDPYLDSYGNTAWGPYFLSGTDGHASLSGTAPGINTAYITVADVDTSREAQDAGILPIPSGNVFCSVNDRLFVAGTSTPSELWVSQQNNPFAFRQVPITDDTGSLSIVSPTSRTFAGESVVQVLKLQGELFGVDSVLVFTNQGVYRLSGYTPEQVVQAARIGDKGCLRAQSATAYDSSVWYLDVERQVRSTNAGLSSIPMSRLKVDDYLAAGTLTGAFGLSGFGCYRVFFQESGAADIRVALTWQEVTGEWVLDRFPWAIVGGVVHTPSTGRAVYVVANTGIMYQLDTSSTTDAGTAIPVIVQSKEFMTPNNKGLVFQRVVVMMDGSVNSTLTTTRTTPYTGSTYVGTLDLTTGNLTTASAWRYDQSASGGVVGTAVTPSALIKIAGDLPAGKRIRMFRIEVGERAGGADVA